MAEPFCDPTSNFYDGSGSFKSLPLLGIASLFSFIHSGGCVVESYCGFNVSRCGASFHVLICYLCILFGEAAVKVFGPFLNRVVCFLIAEC